MESYGGDIPNNVPRKEIPYNHSMLGPVCPPTPYASRSTYAHVVEFGRKGPIRIESMFPLGESGDIRMGTVGELHPEVLTAWGVQTPCAAAELDLDLLRK